MTTFSTKTSSSSALSSIFYPTKEDLRLYKNMALALGAPPNSHMFRFMGAAGQHLVFIGESGTLEWSRVQQTAAGRWPHLPVSGPVASDGTLLDSLPERIVYQMLCALKRRNMHVDVHEPICLDKGLFRTDLTLRKGFVSRYIEVAGCCGSDRITRNEDERKWLARLDQRLSFYRALDVTPVVVWLDMFARPAELKDLCIDLVDDVALRGA
ncbi:hypothetical protein ACLEIY_01235 [Acetobacter tropicalis]|uniref:hypothetical protein n=1 Tax=Acetobacter tropicalis TaxID=104102 RepID=UPI0039752B23